MDKKSRFLAAVEGRAVDRPPVTAWVHFLSDHLPGAEAAGLHLKFQQEYDWDLVKVMNDYRYPVPPGAESLAEQETLQRYRAPLSMDEACFAEQLACLETLRMELGPTVPLIDTLFDPYQQIVRNIGRDQETALWAGGQRALDALDGVCKTMCAYIAAARRAGADGFFLSVNGAIPEGQPRGASREIYERFQRPFNLRLLEAAKGSVRILHVHGAGLDFERVLDYPVDAWSWSDRLPGNPSLAELRTKTSKCLMGGLDETQFSERSRPLLGAQVDDALRQAGRDRFILAPGCTVPSFTPQRLLRFLRDYTLTGSA
jgi:uroporphyrinogen decarboxylase